MSRSDYQTVVATSLGKSNVAAGAGDSYNTFITVAKAEENNVYLDWSYSRGKHGDNDPLWMPERAEIMKAPQHFLKELRSRDLVPPFSTFINAEDVKKDNLHNWRIQSVSIRRDDLDQAAKQGVVFIGDSVHAMPIFGGEGGNHAILDGVELFRVIRSKYGDQRGKVVPGLEIENIVKVFYDGSIQRGQDAVKRCVQRFSGFHKPIQEWMKIAHMSKSTGSKTS